MNVAAILAQKGRDVITIPPHASMIEASHVLAEHRIGAVVVAGAGGEVVGVFSERDLARAVARDGAGVLERPVSAVMTRSLVTADLLHPCEHHDGDHDREAGAPRHHRR